MKNGFQIANFGDWSVLFGVSVWRLWFWCNQFTHTNISCSIGNVLMDVHSRTEEITLTHDFLKKQQSNKIEKLIHWQPPTWPYFKLNTDGALKRSGLASAGGLVRN